ncbi:MAG: hypothetical protein HUK14_05550 [Muribaculaceae bacterium]|nr:hypothetical protein [Muribaculaceae bacterium]
MTRPAHILAALLCAAPLCAYAQETVKLYNTSAVYHEFDDSKNGNYHMTFSSYYAREKASKDSVTYTPADSLGRHWEVYIDVWAGKHNQSSTNKGILPAGTYRTDSIYGGTDTYYAECSFVRQFGPDGDILFQAALPDSITINKKNNNRYQFSFSFDIEGINFVFGAEDPNNKVNIPFDIEGYVPESYDDYVEENNIPTAHNEDIIPPIDDAEIIDDGEQAPSAPEHSPVLSIETVEAPTTLRLEGTTLHTNGPTTVFNTAGRAVLRATAATIDLTPLPAGLYVAATDAAALKFHKN